MIPLCGAHHDAAHRRVLLIGGDAKSGFTFRHADGRPYGSTEVVPEHAQELANTEAILRSLGYKSREARAMVGAIRDTACGAVSAEELLRAALRGAPSVGRAPRVSEAIAVYLA